MDGITIVTGIFIVRAARARACAWLPGHAAVNYNNICISTLKD